MTQKNGTVEFIRGEKQEACVYNPRTKKLIKFSKHDKYFTADPFEISMMKELGFEIGKVKIDGIRVDVDEMTDDEAKRLMRALELRAMKSGDEIPDLAKKVEDDETFVEDSKAEIVEEKVEVTPDIKEDVVIEVSEEKVKKTKKLSSKLKDEI